RRRCEQGRLSAVRASCTLELAFPLWTAERHTKSSRWVRRRILRARLSEGSPSDSRGAQGLTRSNRPGEADRSPIPLGPAKPVVHPAQILAMQRQPHHPPMDAVPLLSWARRIPPYAARRAASPPRFADRSAVCGLTGRYTN